MSRKNDTVKLNDSWHAVRWSDFLESFIWSYHPAFTPVRRLQVSLEKDIFSQVLLSLLPFLLPPALILLFTFIGVAVSS